MDYNGKLLARARERLARLREENPDSSLSELAEMSALSRSGVNHRLRRIVDIAAALDENV